MSHPERGEPNDVLAPDFADFIAALNAHDVEYVVVGGYALAIYGVIRTTGDLDIFHRRTTKNVRKLMAAMREFGAPEQCIDELALMDPTVMTYFGQVPLRIDLLNRISGVTFDEAWANVFEVSTGPERMRVIGLDELIANKRASRRPKDRQDARQLVKANPPTAQPGVSQPRAPVASAPRRKTGPASAGEQRGASAGKSGKDGAKASRTSKGAKASRTTMTGAKRPTKRPTPRPGRGS